MEFLSSIKIKSQKSNLDYCIAFIVAILIFIRCQPYFLWQIETVSRIVCSILIPLLCLQYLVFNKKNTIVFSLFFLSYLLVGLLRNSDILRIINLVLLAVTPILQKQFLLDVFKYFKSIFAFFLMLSLLMYISVILFNLDSTTLIEPLNSLKEYKYFTYPLLVIPDASIDHISRFHATFDEPGVVGTLGGLILCIEKFKLKTWQNIVIFISGLLSFSFYFYFMAIFILVYNSFGKDKLYILIGITFFIALTFSIDFMYDIIWSRFTIDQSRGTISGLNRGEEPILDILKSSLFSKNNFFGYGYDASKEFMGGASIFLIIYREGFLFVLFNILAYIILATHRIMPNKKSLFLFFVILSGTFYQRPALFDVVYIFLFSVMIIKYSNPHQLVRQKIKYKTYEFS